MICFIKLCTAAKGDVKWLTCLYLGAKGEGWKERRASSVCVSLLFALGFFSYPRSEETKINELSLRTLLSGQTLLVFTEFDFVSYKLKVAATCIEQIYWRHFPNSIIFN